MTIESRASGPALVAQGRIKRATYSICDAISAARPVDPGRVANDAGCIDLRRVG
jgi:hypothetical protein